MAESTLNMRATQNAPPPPLTNRHMPCYYQPSIFVLLNIFLFIVDLGKNKMLASVRNHVSM